MNKQNRGDYGNAQNTDVPKVTLPTVLKPGQPVKPTPTSTPATERSEPSENKL